MTTKWLSSPERPIKRRHGASMSQKCVLLRVGIDAGCGGIQGPLFDDGTFEFVCIPDEKGVGVHTYGSLIGRNGRSHLDYFPESRRRQMAGQHIHLDPEFRHSLMAIQRLPSGHFGTWGQATFWSSTAACNDGIRSVAGTVAAVRLSTWQVSLRWPWLGWPVISTRRH